MRMASCKLGGSLERASRLTFATSARHCGSSVEEPLSEMFGYIGDLRTITSGRGQFSMEFSHYAPCPSSVAAAVIDEVLDRGKAA